MSDFISRIQNLSPQRLTLLAMELNARLDAAESAKNDPIAVIGLGCRLPGGVRDAQSYWELLSGGIDAIREIPASRWDIEQYFDPDPDKPGKMNTRWGGFVDDIDMFDPQFFGITPREASSMDPQQRLTLEVAWEALENAGYAPDQLAGSATGVFMGACNNDYFQLLLQAGDAVADMYLSTGSAHSVISGRVSYLLGLRGPSLTLDTACSSSLVAIHTAILSLKKGDCRMALAGGVNAILSPDTTIALSRSKMMATEGRCKAFDASADGFVRSEGCGILVLKRLSHAVADNDRILAVIRGSAINQDGRSNGLTAPNGPSQVSVVRAALTDANLQPSDVSYVETHGTGTSLGDPIEINALAESLGPGHTQENPLMIGSVKTNMGHLESAAGVAGIIKLILSLQHREIPPHLHLTQLNPYISWDQYPITVPTGRTPWRPVNGRWIGGISSFGFSGTNVHILIEAAPQAAERPSAMPEPSMHMLHLSARSMAALQEQAHQLEQHLRANPKIKPIDLSYTLNTGRGTFSRRAALTYTTLDDAVQKLAALAKGHEEADIHNGAAQNRRPQTVFLFSGSGAQWTGMGRKLYDTQPVFRDAIDQCAQLFEPYLPEPLFDILYPSDSSAAPYERMINSQAANFAIQYALVQLWHSWGVVPDLMIGHSLGEYTAAVTAGVFSLEDGVKLVAVRGRLLDSLPQAGAMVAVFANEAQVREIIAPYGQRVGIAAINGPQNIVISGYSEVIDAIVTQLEQGGVKSRRLAITQAAHSPLIDPILDEFEQAAASIRYSSPQIEMVSSLFGRLVDGDEVCNARYWRRHLRETVQFAAGIQSIHASNQVCIEIGPGPMLMAMAQRFLSAEDTVWLSSIRQGKDDLVQILDSLGAAWIHGMEVNWAPISPPGKRLALPTYPFQRQRCWIQAPTKSKQQGKYRPASKGSHPLVERQIHSPALNDIVFETHLSQSWPSFLEHHRIFGVVILPSPAFLEMALTAGEMAFHTTALAIENFSIQTALMLPEDGERTVQILFKPVVNQRSSFQVMSFDETRQSWSQHAAGEIVIRSNAEPELEKLDIAFDLQTIQSRLPTEITKQDYYQQLETLGLEFGPRFQGLEHIWRADGEALGKVVLPEDLTSEAEAYHIHPAFLDASLHLLGAPLPGDSIQTAYLLIGIDRLTIYRKPGQLLWNHTVLEPMPDNHQEVFRGTVRLYDTEGQLVAEATGLQLKRASQEALMRAVHRLPEDWLYRTVWEPKAHQSTPGPLELANTLQEQAANNERQPDYAAYQQLMPRLDQLAAAFIRAAFDRLGFPLAAGQTFTQADLENKLPLLRRYRPLLNRLLEILTETGTLLKLDDCWRVQVSSGDPGLQATATEITVDELIGSYPAYSPEINLLTRCGQNLAGVLRGSIDPLPLLFPQGSFSETENLYGRSPYARAFNSLAAQAVSQRISAHGPVRILEIGAGTGATTAALLPHLPADRTEYSFTDLSPLFLEKARAAFRDQSMLRYKLLDISKDPLAQGFAEHSFDIILAANVFHATGDLRQTLQNTRKLLAPGGLLLLLEGTRKESWVDLTFGLTEGWWQFKDTTLRPEYPLLSHAEWLELLAAEQFVEVASLPGPEVDSISGQEIFLAQTAPEKSADAPGTWIILSDAGDTGIGSHLAQILRQRGETYVQIFPNGISDNDSGAALHPEDPASYRRLLSQAEQLSGTPVKGLIHLWGMDKNTTALGAEPLAASVLYATQALASSNHPQPGRVWIATTGSQPIDPSVAITMPETAVLWGLGRTIAREHPNSWGGLVAFEGTGPGHEAEIANLLFSEIWDSDGEDQVAYLNNERHVLRLERSRLPATQPVPFKENASYLITGGLGGLGLKAARWMARQGARHLVLLSRRGLPPREQWDSLPASSDRLPVIEAIRAIESLGAQVETPAVDIADFQSASELFNQFGKQLPPLRGILHAAADLSNVLLADLNSSQIESMFRPKIQGTWNLHRLSQTSELDFFVLYSSTTSLLGSQYLGHYAAANSFMDAFAHYRRGLGFPAVSINWGTWDTMRAASDAEQERVSLSGLEQMPSDTALDMLSYLLNPEQQSQITVAAVDWSRLRAVYETRRSMPLLEKVADLRNQQPIKSAVSQPSSEGQPTLIDMLKPLSTDDRKQLLVTQVREQVARVIGSPAANIDIRQGLFEMGLDSLMSVELKSRLEVLAAMTLPNTLTFNYPTVDELAGYLFERFQAALTPAEDPAQLETQAQVPAAAITGDNMDDLSEDELAALLSQKLKGT